MNIDTGEVISGEDMDSLPSSERQNFVRIPRHLRQAAMAAMTAGHSLFQGKHAGQQVRSQALDLARKMKAKRRRKMRQQSQRRNRQ